MLQSLQYDSNKYFKFCLVFIFFFIDKVKKKLIDKLYKKFCLII